MSVLASLVFAMFATTGREGRVPIRTAAPSTSASDKCSRTGAVLVPFQLDQPANAFEAGRKRLLDLKVRSEMTPRPE